jgi:putative tryptophan/tyrosine transport system substrate-binding protein
MRRREFILGIGGAAAALPLAARGQSLPRRLGVLMGTPPGDPGGLAQIAAFIKALAELGWVEGRNITIAYRWSGADITLAEMFANELMAFNPDILLARSTPPTMALRRATSTIPIVFVNVAEPISSGIVPNLVRPGGNVTGFTSFEASIGGKWVQLLKEADPRLVRIGVIYNSQTAPYADLFLHSAKTAAPTVGVEIIAMPVQSEADIAAALTALAQRPGGGLVQILDTYTLEHRDAHCAGGALAPAGGLFEPHRDSERRPHRLCGRRLESVPARRHLCGPHSQRRQARRPAGAATDTFRAVDQPQDRQGTWAGNSVSASLNCRRGH